MIIGISGQAGSGKDTAADILVKRHRFCKIALADPMKRAAAEWFGWDKEILWGPSEKRSQEDSRAPGLNARKVLQLLGTQVGRECYKNVWVDYAMDVAKQLLSDPYLMYTPDEGVVDVIEQTSMGEWRRDDAPKHSYKGVVLSDCRFCNEYEAIRKVGGKLLRIKRLGSGLDGVAATHASEAEQQSVSDSEFDYVIDNNGSIEELQAKLAEIMH